jgi:hypothetical protein
VPLAKILLDLSSGSGGVRSPSYRADLENPNAQSKLTPSAEAGTERKAEARAQGVYVKMRIDAFHIDLQTTNGRRNDESYERPVCGGKRDVNPEAGLHQKPEFRDKLARILCFYHP